VAVTEVPASIRTWAVRPGAAALLAAAREKVETGRFGDRTRLLVADDHRADVGRMLGVSWELSGGAVTLKALRETLERAGTTLEAVLVESGGPLRNAAAEKAQAKAADAEQRDRLVATLAAAGIPDPVARLALRWLGSAEQADDTAAQVARAWAALPSRPGHGGGTQPSRDVGLAVFAGRVFDDPHALDRDRPAGRALVRSIAAVHAAAEAADGAPANWEWSSERVEVASAAAADALSARALRAAWARVGVLCDQVSSTVLVLNLPLTGANPALGLVTAVSGEPLWVTSRMTSAGCAVAAETAPGALVVRVCENPAVMEAAAAELGASCPPLICLYGRPSSAAWDVLGAVVSAGGRLLVSGDRDDAGRQIMAEVVDSYPDGCVSAWVPEAAGLYEEQRLPGLLADLAR
jgi:uncharacterized protein (TIGR02679 family)